MSNDRYRGRRDPSFGSDPDKRYGADERRGYDDTHPEYRDDERYSHDSYQPERHYGDDSRRPAYDSPPQDNRAQRSQTGTDRNSYRDDSGYDRQSNRQSNGQSNRQPNGQSNRQPNGHSDRVSYPVRFHGKTSEYFKIWIVNVFLTVITLYIYSAWAKVRTKRYFYGNTTIDGSSFEYHARGGQLVVGRLIAAVLLITYTVSQGINATLSLIALGILVIMFPWAIWRSLRFNAKATSFRNIRFGFDGKAFPPYLNVVIIPALIFALIGAATYIVTQQLDGFSVDSLSDVSPEMINIIAGSVVAGLVLLLVLVVPLLHKNLISYSHNNHRYGTAPFAANIKTGRIYGIHFVTFLLTLLALAIISGAVALGIKLIQQSPALLDNSELLTRLEPYYEIIAGLAVYLVAIPAGSFAVAYFKSAIRNHRYNSTTIDNRVSLHSTTGTWSLWWLNISNLLLLIITLGFAYPYTKIRSARYFARRTTVSVAGGLDSFTAQEKTRLNAMGEEMADAFDVEFDIGI